MAAGYEERERERERESLTERAQRLRAEFATLLEDTRHIRALRESIRKELEETKRKLREQRAQSALRKLSQPN